MNCHSRRDLHVSYSLFLQSFKYLSGLFNCLYMLKIREMASNILKLYFSWPLPSALLKEEAFSGSAASPLLDTALRHCNSTRPRECDTGALLCTVVFTGLVRLLLALRSTITFALQMNSQAVGYTVQYNSLPVLSQHKLQ